MWREKRGENVAPSKICTATTLFVWDGDVMEQEVQESKTATYVYEPDSFVPLARIESNDGAEYLLKSSLIDAEDEHPRYVNLSHISEWDLSAARQRLELHDAHDEDFHQVAWKRRQRGADEAARNDRIDHYSCDHLGTPRELVDDKGSVVWSARFKAWGQVIKEDNHEVNQPLRFQGQYADAETGLHYNRYRYYDPNAARYITSDPIGLLGGLNGYSFAANPTAWTDPLGLSRECPKSPKCDPCDGKNPAAEALSKQGPLNAPYIGLDSYTNVVLKKGTILYSLYPGDVPGFAVTNHTLIAAKGDVAKYHQLTQVIPGIDRKTGLPRKMRGQLSVYRVNEDICVAKGKALAQDPAIFGSGGATQYYISPTDAGKLTISRKPPRPI